MSDAEMNEAEQAETTAAETAEKKAREPKKNSIPTDEIATKIEGIPQYEKTSFRVIGHKDGVRLAIPLTSGISRAYFYGAGDYSVVPQHAAITVFTEEQRKEQRKGGIMAEIDFEKGLDSAREALDLMIEAVRKAPAPAPKALTKPKAPKKAKAASVTETAEPASTEASPSGEQGESPVQGD